MATLDTFGWDVVHAVTLTATNGTLQRSGVLPPSFETANAQSATSASGTWSPWQLAPGAPSNYLYMECTVAAGTANMGSGPVDIAGAKWVMQFMPEVGTDGVIRPSASNAPRIARYTVPPTVSGSAVYQLVELFDALLISQIGSMKGGFGQIAVGAGSMSPAQTWLVPTSARAATNPLPKGDPRGGILAILAMTEGRPDMSLQTAVDARIFDGAPASSNAALIVGPNRITSDLLLPALAALVQGSSESDFSVSNSGTLYNANKMTWGTFNYVEGTQTYPVKPIIPRGNIELAMDGPVFHLSMSNINFSYPGWEGPGHITVSFGAEQFTTFDIVLRDDGELVLVPKTGHHDSFNVTVVPSEELQIFQIALNVVLQVLFAVIGGVIDSAAGAAEGAAERAMEEEAEGSISAEMGSQEIDGLISGNADESEIEDADAEAAEEGANAVANEGDAGFVQGFKSSLKANKSKILLKIVSKMVEIPAGKMTDIAVAAARHEFGKLPSITPFASGAMRPVTWASGSGVKVVGGALDGALIFWGQLSDGKS